MLMERTQDHTRTQGAELSEFAVGFRRSATVDGIQTGQRTDPVYAFRVAFWSEIGGFQVRKRLDRLGDVILIDRDYLTCRVAEIPTTRVLYTIVGGRVVYERKK